MTILDWIKEFFDPWVLLFYCFLFGYCLWVDVPGLRRKKLKREATVVSVLSWTSIGLYLGLLALVMLA